MALYEEALKLDPNNIEASNRLGQRLDHLAQLHGDDINRYRKSQRHLARVTFIDDHAKLFHGWSSLFVARADRDSLGEERAIADSDEAMKRWAFGGRDGSERASWNRQLDRMKAAELLVEADRLH